MASQPEQITNKQQPAATLPRKLSFRFRTLADINEVLSYLSQWLPAADNFLLGIKEIMVNAVEHGNLGIGYALKTDLLENGKWLNEVQTRLDKPENRNKFAFLEISFNDNTLEVTVEDQGAGFKPDQFLRADNPPDGATNFNGRGLKLVNALAFDRLAFSKGGRCFKGVKVLEEA